MGLAQAECVDRAVLSGGSVVKRIVVRDGAVGIDAVLRRGRVTGELDRAEAFGSDILRKCVAVGGVLTGEHGVGVEKRDLMPVMFSEIAF